MSTMKEKIEERVFLFEEGIWLLETKKVVRTSDESNFR